MALASHVEGPMSLLAGLKCLLGKLKATLVSCTGINVLHA